MSSLTNNYIITKDEANLLDKKTFELNSIPPIVLMEEASERIFSHLKQDFNNLKNEKIAIISGWGNNGGDSLSIARKMFFDNIKVDIYLFPDHEGSELYNKQLEILKTLPVNIFNIEKLKNNIGIYTIIIDGIFGIGYKYKKDNQIEYYFSLINNSDAVKISIDVPSGLDNSNNISIISDYTYSIGLIKDYFFTINTRKKVGIIRDIKISFNINNIQPLKNIFYFNKLNPLLKKNNNFVHKYSRGGCISIGGQKGKFGSIIYAAKSALRTGCGISLILTEKNNILFMNTMAKDIIIDKYENIDSYIQKYNTIIIGPGLNNLDDNNKQLLKSYFSIEKQFILDASFFSYFNQNDLKLFKIPPILTPHTQEFKTFFNNSEELNSKTIDIISNTAKKNNIYLLLKDSFMIFSKPNGDTFVFDNPNRILAQAGSGDILSGIIGGIISQGYNPEEAIIQGIRIFFNISDKFKNKGYNSYIPDKFIDLISKENI